MKYKKAPIQEAVFDIRIDKLAIQKIDELESFHEFIKMTHPDIQKKHNLHSSIQFNPEKPIKTNATANLVGFVFLNESKNSQIQVRIDVFTLNIIDSYDNWDFHFSEFINNWTQYNEKFKPLSVIRIATRFINRIKIPIPFTSFQEYINIMPPIPQSLPQSFSNFFMQIQVPCADNLRNTVITETIDTPQNNILPFILDIDVFQDLKLENAILNLKQNFSQIRNIKNEIFESCITDKTRELFQ